MTEAGLAEVGWNTCTAARRNVYQGEEIGMTNASLHTIADFRDIEAIGQYTQAVDQEGRTPQDVLTVLRARGRDNARTPMQWNASPQAGFTTVRAEIDDAAAWVSAELVLTNTAAPPSDDLVLGPWQAVVYRRTISR